jgi:exodeoxyribonuclease-3
VNILIWNINGLRAFLKKDKWDWLESLDPDLICFQEIKARPDQLTKAQMATFGARELCWNPAERPGYSGVATFCKHAPDEVVLGMDAPEFDAEGRVLQTWYGDTGMFNIYFPNGQRDQERLDYKLAFYEHLLNYCQNLRAQGKEIILGGDFNTCHTPIDLARPKENKNTSGFMQIERDWVQNYIDAGFVDLFRHKNPEQVQYSWWTYRMNARARNIGWRLDYYMVTPGLIGPNADTIIHDDIVGSDHCPVSLMLN